MSTNNMQIEDYLNNEREVLDGIIALINKKIPFTKWPASLYSVFFQALQPLGNQIEQEKAKWLSNHLGLSVDLPSPSLTKEQVAHSDIKFWRSVERTRADLAGCVKFKAAQKISVE